MDETVLYIVKSVIPNEHVREFDEWYHKKHIPEFIARSGCERARRFKAVQSDDQFEYMAIYEFSNRETFLKYQQSEAKKELVGDFIKTFSDRAELRTSIWEQVYP
jgi:hypothetical protein